MDHYDDHNNDNWDSFEEPKRDFQDLPRRRRRLNPSKMKINRVRRTKHKQLPVKASKEMSLRKAKKLLYGSRTPGRPSKSLSSQLREAKRLLQKAGLPLKRHAAKPSVRGRGRPKKLNTVKKEKRPRGRPRKPPAVAKPKRPRGRPKKPAVASTRPKRARGRPRKNPLQQLADSAKKRMRKNPDVPLD